MQNWIHKATVQSALVVAIGAIIAALITSISNINNENKSDKTIIKVENYVRLSGEDKANLDKILEILEKIKLEKLDIKSTKSNGITQDVLLLLIDVSASMSGQRMAHAKSGIIDITKRYKYDLIGVIAFDILGVVILPLNNYPPPILKMHLYNLAVSGGTDLSDALQKSITIMQRTSGKNKRIIIVSDGGFGTLQNIDLSIKENITIDMFYVGDTNPRTIIKKMPWLNQLILVQPSSTS